MEAQSHLSPGPVLDHEELGRFLYRPEHLTPDGKVTPAAFPTKELLEPDQKGLSLGRLHHLSAQDIRRRAAEYEARARANRFFGLGVVRAARVRELRTPQGRRELCVVDDALPEFVAHALLQLADRGAYDKGSVRRVRQQLLELTAFRRRQDYLDS